MIRKYVLPLAALCLLVFAVYHVLGGEQEPPPSKPPVAPARSPFSKTVAGAGMVEAQTENIEVGTPVPGVVTEVRVKVGQKVKAGEGLFRLDARQLEAERKYREAALAAAKAQLARLEAMPRPEELPASEARVREAQANLAEQEDLHQRARRASVAAVGAEELVRRELAVRKAKEQLAREKAELALQKAGAWKLDVEVSRAAVEQAKAQLGQVKTDLERLTVRALVAGEVLQVNVHPGEFVGAPASRTLVLLGNVHRLHVRVDVDEHDIPRFSPGTPARAVLRGDQKKEFRLKFVRVEPYVVPKRSLTGDNTERVDTRVLQVIYALEPGAERVYVGQLLDVFIDAGEEKSAPSPGASR